MESMKRNPAKTITKIISSAIIIIIIIIIKVLHEAETNYILNC